VCSPGRQSPEPEAAPRGLQALRNRETEETMASRREFTYSVVPREGRFGVVELPVYVP